MIRIILVISAAVLVSGCESIPKMVGCPDARSSKINIVFAKNDKIRVSPGNANTKRGDVLRFRLTGDPAKTVTVQGKASDPASAWISGGGNGGQVFYVCVDPNQVPDPGAGGKTYSYDIIIPGVGVLDPEVTVRR